MFFHQIENQKENITQLKYQKKTGKIPHAQLFDGTANDAGFALAWAYSRYLNCLDATEYDSCGNCEICKFYNHLTHPDLYLSFPIPQDQNHKISASYLSEFRALMLENPYTNIHAWHQKLDLQQKSSSIGVQESQEILNHAQLTSFNATYKTIILWLPEHLHPSAGNKLLKIVEEPPKNTIFIAITQAKDQVLGTLLSRLQPIKIFSTAENSFDSTLYFDFFSHWMRLCFKKDVPALLDWVEQQAAKGRMMHKAFLEYALQFLQQILHQHYVEKNLNLDKNSEEEKIFIYNISPYLTPDILLRIYEILEQSYRDIERNANAKILWMDTSLQIFQCFKKK